MQLIENFYAFIKRYDRRKRPFPQRVERKEQKPQTKPTKEVTGFCKICNQEYYYKRIYKGKCIICQKSDATDASK